MKLPQCLTCVLSLGVIVSIGCEQPNWFSANKQTEAESKEKSELHDFANAKEAPLPRMSASTLLAAGQMLERQNDIPGAIVQYEKAVVVDPEQVVAYNRLGVLYQRMSRFEESEKMFHRGLQIKPNSAMLRNNFGFTLLQRQRYSDAMEQFHAALEAYPKFRRARMNLAITLTKMKRFNDAVTEFSRLLPREMAYYNVAVICADMHDYINAEISLHKALDVNPQCKPVLAQWDRIATLARTARQQADLPQMPQPTQSPPTAKISEAQDAPSTETVDPMAGIGIEDDSTTDSTNMMEEP